MTSYSNRFENFKLVVFFFFFLVPICSMIECLWFYCVQVLAAKLFQLNILGHIASPDKTVYIAFDFLIQVSFASMFGRQLLGDTLL